MRLPAGRLMGDCTNDGNVDGSRSLCAVIVVIIDLERSCALGIQGPNSQSFIFIGLVVLKIYENIRCFVLASQVCVCLVQVMQFVGK